MIWRAELGGAGAGGALYHHLPFLQAEAAGKLNLEDTLQQCTTSDSQFSSPCHEQINDCNDLI